MKTFNTIRRAVALLLTVVCLLGALSVAAFAAAVGAVKVKQTDRTTNAVSISWTVSGSVSGVELLRYNTKTRKFDSLGKTTKKTYRLKGLTPGSDYLMEVRPYLKSGGKTVNGKAVQVRVYTGLNAVTGIKQTEATEKSHKLSWKKVPGAEKYEVYYFNPDSKKFVLLGDRDKPYVNMVNLKSATLYQYRVRAVSVGYGGKRINAPVSKTFTAYTIPGKINNFKVQEVSTEGYRLQWDAVHNATGYIVSRFNEATGQYEELAKTPVPSYVVRDLEPGTSDYYKIRAYATLQKVNRLGEETAQQVATTKPDTVTPKYLSGDPMKGKIKVGWTPNEKCDGYCLFLTDADGANPVKATEIPKSVTKSAVIVLPAKARKVYVAMQTYVITDRGRVYSDLSPVLKVKTQPQTTTAAKAADQTTTKAN